MHTTIIVAALAAVVIGTYLFAYIEGCKGGQQ